MTGGWEVVRKHFIPWAVAALRSWLATTISFVLVFVVNRIQASKSYPRFTLPRLQGNRGEATWAGTFVLHICASTARSRLIVADSSRDSVLRHRGWNTSASCRFDR